MSNDYIVFVGSCNMDFVSYGSRLPKEGESVLADEFQTDFAGKSANQCIAAAKLGAKAYLIARLGDDFWSDNYIEYLKKFPTINTNYVKKTKNSGIGIAQCLVSENGSNQIVIVTGANKFLSIEDVNKAKDIIEKAAVLIVTLETAPEVVIRAMQLCKGTVILNASPAIQPYDPLLLKLPKIFCINELEASTFTNLPVTNKLQAEIACEKLLEMGCNNVILTLGENGAIFRSKTEEIYVKCPKVKCINTVGAGDGFAGALTYFLTNHKELSMEKIMEYSCFVASDSVTRKGTQASYPYKDILEKLPLCK